MFEELEQIPWSELMPRPRRPGRWAWLAVIGAVTVAGLVIWSRTSTPVPAVVQEPLIGQPSFAPPAEGSISMQPVSEADLRAADDADELMALGAALVEIRSLTTTDRYVEWAVAEDLRPLRDGLWSVQVAFQYLVAGDDGAPMRPPVVRVEVPVEIVTGVAGRAGPITLIDYSPREAADAWEIEPAPLDPLLEEATKRHLEPWGAAEIQAAGTTDGRWRVVVDVAGMELALWLSPDGELVDAPVPSGS